MKHSLYADLNRRIVLDALSPESGLAPTIALCSDLDRGLDLGLDLAEI